MLGASSPSQEISSQCQSPLYSPGSSSSGGIDAPARGQRSLNLSAPHVSTSFADSTAVASHTSPFACNSGHQRMMHHTPGSLECYTLGTSSDTTGHPTSQSPPSHRLVAPTQVFRDDSVDLQQLSPTAGDSFCRLVQLPSAFQTPPSASTLTYGDGGSGSTAFLTATGHPNRRRFPTVSVCSPTTTLLSCLTDTLTPLPPEQLTLPSVLPACTTAEGVDPGSPLPPPSRGLSASGPLLRTFSGGPLDISPPTLTLNHPVPVPPLLPPGSHAPTPAPTVSNEGVPRGPPALVPGDIGIKATTSFKLTASGERPFKAFGATTTTTECCGLTVSRRRRHGTPLLDIPGARFIRSEECTPLHPGPHLGGDTVSGLQCFGDLRCDRSNLAATGSAQSLSSLFSNRSSRYCHRTAVLLTLRDIWPEMPESMHVDRERLYIPTNVTKRLGQGKYGDVLQAELYPPGVEARVAGATGGGTSSGESFHRHSSMVSLLQPATHLYNSLSGSALGRGNLELPSAHANPTVNLGNTTRMAGQCPQIPIHQMPYGEATASFYNSGLLDSTIGRSFLECVVGADFTPSSRDHRHYEWPSAPPPPFNTGDGKGDDEADAVQQSIPSLPTSPSTRALSSPPPDVPAHTTTPRHIAGFVLDDDRREEVVECRLWPLTIASEPGTPHTVSPQRSGSSSLEAVMHVPGGGGGTDSGSPRSVHPVTKRTLPTLSRLPTSHSGSLSVHSPWPRTSSLTDLVTIASTSNALLEGGGDLRLEEASPTPPHRPTIAHTALPSCSHLLSLRSLCVSDSDGSFLEEHRSCTTVAEKNQRPTLTPLRVVAGTDSMAAAVLQRERRLASHGEVIPEAAFVAVSAAAATSANNSGRGRQCGASPGGGDLANSSANCRRTYGSNGSSLLGDYRDGKEETGGGGEGTAILLSKSRATPTSPLIEDTAGTTPTLTTATTTTNTAAPVAAPFRSVAVKKVRKVELSRPQSREALRNELSMACKLQHPCLVNIFGVSEDHDNVYLIMDLAERGNMHEYQQTYGVPDTREMAPRFLADVVLALEYCHDGRAHPYVPSKEASHLTPRLLPPEKGDSSPILSPKEGPPFANRFTAATQAKSLSSTNSETSLLPSARQTVCTTAGVVAQEDSTAMHLEEHLPLQTDDAEGNHTRYSTNPLPVPSSLSADSVVAETFPSAPSVDTKSYVLHRDLKPDNLLLTWDYHVKVGDFGTACFLGDVEANRFAGTADYIAPETLLTNKAVAETDLWALGCILYYLLEGRAPFHANTVYMTQRNVKNYQPGDLPFSPGVDPAAQDLVNRLLQPNPQDRLGSEDLGGLGILRLHPFFRDIDWSCVLETTNITPVNTNYTAELSDYLLNGEEVVYCSPVQPLEETLRSGSGSPLRSCTVDKDSASLSAAAYHPAADHANEDEAMSHCPMVLVLTNTPRLFLVDPENDDVALTVPWSQRLRVDVEQMEIFSLTAPPLKRVMRFLDTNRRADLWGLKVNAAVAAGHRSEWLAAQPKTAVSSCRSTTEGLESEPSLTLRRPSGGTPNTVTTTGSEGHVPNLQLHLPNRHESGAASVVASLNNTVTSLSSAPQTLLSRLRSTPRSARRPTSSRRSRGQHGHTDSEGLWHSVGPAAKLCPLDQSAASTRGNVILQQGMCTSGHGYTSQDTKSASTSRLSSSSLQHQSEAHRASTLASACVSPSSIVISPPAQVFNPGGCPTLSSFNLPSGNALSTLGLTESKGTRSATVLSSAGGSFPVECGGAGPMSPLRPNEPPLRQLPTAHTSGGEGHHRREKWHQEGTDPHRDSV